MKKLTALVLLLFFLIACSGEAPEKVPENSSVVNNIGVLYVNQGMNDEAIEQFEKVLKIDSNHEVARKNLALLYYGKGNYSEAGKHWKKLTREYPDNPEYHYDLAINYADNCQYNQICELDKAIHHFNRSEQIEPGYANAEENIVALRNVQEQMGEGEN